MLYHRRTSFIYFLFLLVPKNYDLFHCHFYSLQCSLCCVQSLEVEIIYFSLKWGHVFEQDAYLLFLDIKAAQTMTKSKRGLKLKPQKLVLVKISSTRPFFMVKVIGAYLSVGAYSMGGGGLF